MSHSVDGSLSSYSRKQTTLEDRYARRNLTGITANRTAVSHGVVGGSLRSYSRHFQHKPTLYPTQLNSLNTNQPNLTEPDPSQANPTQAKPSQPYGTPPNPPQRGGRNPTQPYPTQPYPTQPYPTLSCPTELCPYRDSHIYWYDL